MLDDASVSLVVVVRSHGQLRTIVARLRPVRRTAGGFPLRRPVPQGAADEPQAIRAVELREGRPSVDGRGVVYFAP